VVDRNAEIKCITSLAYIVQHRHCGPETEAAQIGYSSNFITTTTF